MTRKLYTLVSTCVGAVATVATAVITYTQPANATAWVAAVGIAATAINEIMVQFIENEQ